MSFNETFPVRRYLERIGYHGPTNPSFELLAQLQERHLLSVPYENLDILAGNGASLEFEDLFRKIVEQRRGGYCFELNRLFAHLLRALGFDVTDYVARFWRDESHLPPKRRHHVLGVALHGERFLADVGVGGIVPRWPLVIREGGETVQGQECYRLDRDDRFGWFLMERKRAVWSRLYSFSEEPQEEKDFVFAHYWCMSAPDSPFVTSPIVAIRTADGRITIAGNELRVFSGDTVTRFKLESAESFRDGLKQYFGLALPNAFPWASLPL